MNKGFLHFNGTENFDVLVSDNGQNFAGKLTVSPTECTLRVMGERVFSPNFRSSEVIECFTLRDYFLLAEISVKSMRNTNLRLSDPCATGGFYEIEFKVGFIVKSNTSIYKDTLFSGFHIDADMIKKWTGITNKQNDLLMRHGGASLGTQDNELFTKAIENIGVFSLFYNINLHTSLESISSGVNITPCIGFFFKETQELQIIIKEIKKLYTLLSYFWGEDFAINYVKIYLPNSSGTKICAFFNTKINKDLINWPLMPLGLDVMNSYNNYQGLPLEFLDNYYNLPDSELEFFTKYLRYKRLKSNEEKFLGYFRILERLVHDTGTYVDAELLESILERSSAYLRKKLECNGKNLKSLISKIKYANGGKYNTTACITRFFDEIPEEIRKELLFDKTKIEMICKLRNDMTHANEFDVLEKDLYFYTKFIHQLLICALFNKLLKLSLDILVPLSRSFSFIKI